MIRELEFTVGFRDSDTSRGDTENALNDTAQFDWHVGGSKSFIEKDLAFGIKGCRVVNETASYCWMTSTASSEGTYIEGVRKVLCA